MTIIEMLMSITIIVLGMEGFSLLFMRTWRSNSFALEMGQASMAVSQGLGQMVNHIRGTRQADSGAYPIKSADDNDLVLYSDYDKDGVTERLHFYKSGQSILMGATDPTSTMPRTYPSGDQQTITVANSIVNGVDEPVFYYFDKEFAGDEAGNPPLGTPADIEDVRIIKIFLKINIDPNRAPDNVEMQSFVEMRNLNDYDRMR